MRKTHLVLAAMAMTFSSVSLADLRVSSMSHGAWVTVTEQGHPAANATVSLVNVPQVRQTFQTDENGRVFLPISINNSRSIKFKAVTEEGNVYSRFAFHSDKRQ